MTAGVRVLLVNRACQHLNGAQEESPVFFGGALQIEDEALQVRSHAVEGVGEFADLGAALYLDTLRKVSASDSAARFSERLQRCGKLPGGEDSECQAEQNRKQSE